MSTKEGIFYAGLMAGLVIGVTVARMLGLHHLIGLLAGAVLGLGLGYGAQKFYLSITGSSIPPTPDDREQFDRKNIDDDRYGSDRDAR